MSKLRQGRPLSPFMLGLLYRWQISSVTSMIHRITGVGLVFSFIYFVLWITGLAAGGWYGDLVAWFTNSWIGILIWAGSLWALWYHLINGIRHLCWDLGLGFDVGLSFKTGLVSIFGSFAMTAFTLAVIYIL